MKIKVVLLDKEICIIDADMDTKQAIAVGETMENQKFNELFATSILQELIEHAKTDKQSAKLYWYIRDIISDTWAGIILEYPERETQKEFDKMFAELVTTDIKFIPLL